MLSIANFVGLQESIEVVRIINKNISLSSLSRVLWTQHILIKTKKYYKVSLIENRESVCFLQTGKFVAIFAGLFHFIIRFVSVSPKQIQLIPRSSGYPRDMYRIAHSSEGNQSHSINIGIHHHTDIVSRFLRVDSVDASKTILSLQNLT